VTTTTESRESERSAYLLAAARLETATQALDMARHALGSTPVIVGAVDVPYKATQVRVETASDSVRKLHRDVSALLKHARAEAGR
jgi:hypothetical protein